MHIHMYVSICYSYECRLHGSIFEYIGLCRVKITVSNIYTYLNDQIIFTVHQILKNTRKRKISSYHLLVDFEVAFDSTKKSCLYADLSEYGILA